MRQEKIDCLCQEFIAHHRYRITTRRWYKIAAVMGIIVSCLIERSSTTHLEKQLATLDDRLSAVTSLVQEKMSTAAQRSVAVVQPALRNMPQYVGRLLSRPFKAVWHAAKYLVFATLAQKFISTLVDQLTGPLGANITLPAADFWFLHEQVKSSNVFFVAVKEELNKFLIALNALEESINRIDYAQQQSLPLMNEYLCDIMYKGEELIAHIAALHTLVPAGDGGASYELLVAVRKQLSALLENFCGAMYVHYNVYDVGETSKLCSSTVAHMRFIIRPLQSLTTYHILPWPFSIALEESLHRIISMYLTDNANPLKH